MMCNANNELSALCVCVISVLPSCRGSTFQMTMYIGTSTFLDFWISLLFLCISETEKLICGMFTPTWQSHLILIVIIIASCAIYWHCEKTQKQTKKKKKKADRVLNDLGAPLKLDWKVLRAASPYHY